MMIMPGNNAGIVAGWLAGSFPGRIGHLISPGGHKGPYPFLPYALDNGAFSNWDEPLWLKLLEWARISGQKPLWTLVPDVVADREATLQRWQQYSPMLISRYGWPLAFAVQDDMTPDDVPEAAEVIFIGGTTEWKWRTLRMWCESFPRTHVGRVNNYRRLWQCREAGAESADGTGWFKGDHGSGRPLRDLVAFLTESTDGRRKHEQLELSA